jgi:hypothetical protein
MRVKRCTAYLRIRSSVPCATDQPEPTLYSITSSAPARSVGGISRGERRLGLAAGVHRVSGTIADKHVTFSPAMAFPAA